MLAPRLPEQILPFKHARQGLSLDGLLAFEKMERFTELLADSQGEVEVKLQFGIDEQGTSFVRGHLSAEANIVCQRCMEPMRIPLETDVSIAFVSSDEQASHIPEGYEPFTVIEEKITLADLIEDELILALPIVAVHSDQSCQSWFDRQEKEIVAEKAEEKENPFAVLASLKRNK